MERSVSDRIGILEEMTIDEVKALAPNTALLPLGSTEPHGPALPYGTDTFQTDVICKEAVRFAVKDGARAVCYPTLPITLNNNFRAFPFACRVGVRTFQDMLTDIIDQMYADGIRRVAISNGHGGNGEAIGAVMRDLAGRDDAPFVCTFGCWGMCDESVKEQFTNRSDHAGEEETSLQMAVRPELVRRDRLADNPRGKLAVKALTDRRILFVRPWHLYVPQAAGGDQRAASAEQGQAVIESAARNIANLLVELSRAPESANFPYE